MYNDACGHEAGGATSSCMSVVDLINVEGKMKATPMMAAVLLRPVCRS